ncbi:uncharacterized protein VDAG_09118 [Verticillium dahliae VdLs.17]|uniref:Uncharacterized protein n=1 Tax=Verticillium dahliae (strain VdLs.17 / ATCC MYA-4575 / FGSC 10137) TaxID=498257 RepID=G2XFJ4_VERDV|nr:uncharacterized protein VDAG_09118 [Verticillium dahliae VdLs.17]EGY18592.1 hypothetical protein VDAG_09118 [Verticillium dahliae VdLs.17]KAH6691995.1 hypothetical protein EV126DRAFT_347324 [Verticillium dahliae]
MAMVPISITYIPPPPKGGSTDSHTSKPEIIFQAVYSGLIVYFAIGFVLGACCRPLRQPQWFTRDRQKSRGPVRDVLWACALTTTWPVLLPVLAIIRSINKRQTGLKKAARWKRHEAMSEGGATGVTELVVAVPVLPTAGKSERAKTRFEQDLELEALPLDSDETDEDGRTRGRG